MLCRFAVAVAFVHSVCSVWAAGPLPRGADVPLANAGFEARAEGEVAEWGWWSRDGKGDALADGVAHGGSAAARVVYDGERDWNLSCPTKVPASEGEIFVARAWVKCRDAAGVRLDAVARDADGKVISWHIGARGATQGTHDWLEVVSLIAPPEGTDHITVRFVGRGPGRVWFDEVSLERVDIGALRGAVKPKVEGWAAERAIEKLDRGLVAVPRADGAVYVSWRLLDSDPPDARFHVYRRGPEGETRRLTEEPVGKTTDYVDDSAKGLWQKAPLAYSVAMVWKNRERARSAPSRAATVGPDSPVGYIAMPMRDAESFMHVGIADLDGDGRYDYLLKQPGENIDPYEAYWKPSPETYKIDAYRSDGEFLWRRDLGWAIERGTWYSPCMAWDLDGDGRAEVAAKTGEGDPRDADGRVRTGAEYLSVFDGLTGEELARAPWPSREGFEAEGGYNRASRNQMGIAYLDGKTPCLIAARGTYGLMKCEAWTFHKGRLERMWQWCNEDEILRLAKFRGQGAHFMHCADIDGDGRDEVLLGSCVLDDNGEGLWSTGLGHPDHFYLGDIDPARPGLEIYYGIETRSLRYGVCLADAATGKILWGLERPTRHVHSTGLVSDFDSRSPGMECYSGEKETPSKENAYRWLHAADGRLLATEKEVEMSLAPRAVYWDADPQREILRWRKLYDFETGEVFLDNVPPRHRAWADILGDWREEIVTYEAGEVRIYTTAIPAQDRRLTLMRDPIYRRDVAHLFMGYAQAPTTSYCLSATKDRR